MHSNWMKFQTSSCQKRYSWWNCIVAWMILGWSSIKIMLLVLIQNPRWSPSPYKVKHRTLWEFHLKFNSSETTVPIWTKLDRNGPWVVPFQNLFNITSGLLVREQLRFIKALNKMFYLKIFEKKNILWKFIF